MRVFGALIFFLFGVSTFFSKILINISLMKSLSVNFILPLYGLMTSDLGVQGMFTYCFPDSHYLQGLQGWTGRMESFGDERELPASFASGSCGILPTWSLPSRGSSFLQQLNLVPRFSNAHTTSFILSHWRRRDLCRHLSSEGFNFI